MEVAQAGLKPPGKMGEANNLNCVLATWPGWRKRVKMLAWTSWLQHFDAFWGFHVLQCWVEGCAAFENPRKSDTNSPTSNLSSHMVQEELCMPSRWTMPWLQSCRWSVRRHGVARRAWCLQHFLRRPIETHHPDPYVSATSPENISKRDTGPMVQPKLPGWKCNFGEPFGAFFVLHKQTDTESNANKLIPVARPYSFCALAANLNGTRRPVCICPHSRCTSALEVINNSIACATWCPLAEGGVLAKKINGV